MAAAVIAQYDYRVDTRSVTCFLRVAETLHFGRAAIELHLSQPALSQRIKTLERDLGVTLLERNRRGVRLTDAGTAFLDPARAMVVQADHAADLARRAQSGLSGRLRLGFTVVASYTPLPIAVQRFRARYPDVTVELTEISSPAVEDALHVGAIDLGIVHPPLERPDLEHSRLDDETLVLAVPEGHELAQATDLRFADLSGQPLLAAPRAVGPVIFDALMACFRADGVEPRVVQEAMPMTTLAGLVAAGAGIGFVTSGIAAAGRPGVRFVPVADAPTLPVAVAWRAPAPSATAAAFCRALRQPTGLTTREHRAATTTPRRGSTSA
jgi:DNA-binding transcriptional LysR family regulator